MLGRVVPEPLLTKRSLEELPVNCSFRISPAVKLAMKLLESISRLGGESATEDDWLPVISVPFNMARTETLEPVPLLASTPAPYWIK